ncbi:hypothetical protein [Saccharopolyspora elongata]|uniref:4-amino-4-deoxy-L-arabinose transferase-like glycosyltransferase n=1 Tax=Saccharopolyspora elongata TaxID=2530387 RepID=A0A4R4YSB2_9PSEU|nr:hypothetical protein [Saccharopolyspora elongata]TDD48103.1 hypothetical protein E1288_22630 [Saccharopolyspora elongata]
MAIEQKSIDISRLATDRRGKAGSARWRRDRSPWLVLVVALVAGQCFVGVNLYYNSGHYIPFLDDAYIHMQYAVQIGQGDFLRFHDGDPISTGASSLLYVTLIGAVYLAGVQGSMLLPAAVMLGVVCHALTAAGITVLGRRLAGRTAGIWAGTLVALSGPLLWGATSGMEISFTALLLVCTLVMFTAEAPRALFRFTPVLAALAALSRLEAFVFVSALSLVMIVNCWRRPGWGSAQRTGWALWCALPFVVTAAQLGFYKLATGSASLNGSVAKSLFSAPNFTLGEFASSVAGNVGQLLAILIGMSRQDFTFPGALLLAVIGVTALMRRGGVRRMVGLVTVVGTSLAVLAISTMATALWQNVRYLQPFLPLFVLAAVIGVGSVTSWFSGRVGRQVSIGLLSVAALFTAVSLPTWAHIVGQDSSTIRDRVVTLATWTKGHLPPGVRIGVHDVGAAAYLGGHKTVDLVGLTTNGLAKAAINGMGSLYEELRAMPPRQRPDYIVVFDAMQIGVQLQKLADASLFDEAVVKVPEMTVWKANWSLADTGDRPMTPVPGQIRDYVDVGSMRSERDHDHDVHESRMDSQPGTLVRTADYAGQRVVDSARHVLGEEEFTLHNLVPGRPVRLIARHDSGQPNPDADTVNVVVNGVGIGPHRLAPDARGWAESTITIPPELVTDSEITVRMAAMQEFVGPYPDYDSFGYWAVQ